MSKRVETGPVQFGDDDWPGVFIRGDEAMGVANPLRDAIELVGKHHGPLAAESLRGLLEVLLSCYPLRGRETPVPIADLRRPR